MAHLPYDVTSLKREQLPHYIGTSPEETRTMLSSLGADCVDDLFSHLPPDIRYPRPPAVCSRKSYQDLVSHMEEISQKNTLRYSFLGPGLPHYKTHPIVPFVSSLRGLSTAYTPYQPECSQGTLHSLWIYASALSVLTGFKAISSGLYDRSMALFEALNTALRIKKGRRKVLVHKGIGPRDTRVLETLSRHTPMELISTSGEGAEDILRAHREDVAAFCFPAVNHFGHLEDVHTLTDLCYRENILSVALIDPMLLAPGGHLPPSQWGLGKSLGTAMFVGEGQHLALGPHFGGPGLGLFGILFDEKNKNLIRHAPGRFVGKTRDIRGRECFCLVLSTREQHIRRAKATSNICSNQSFVATLVGASLLAQGSSGLGETLALAKDNALRGYRLLTAYRGIEPAFPKAPFFNEFTLRVPKSGKELISLARNYNLHLGTSLGTNLIHFSFSDCQEEAHFVHLEKFLKAHFEKKDSPPPSPPSVPENFRRREEVSLPQFPLEKTKDFYRALSRQNLSPDDNLYPLGSCTMKYNPHLNDWASNLPGFAHLHPAVPEEDAQGTLEILYRIQEYFKEMTNLAATGTTPVAGAQGELVGLKMIQAYHWDGGRRRDVVLIPESAHGTNPATATMAGFLPENIVLLATSPEGQVDTASFQGVLEKYGHRTAALMITNPNTMGIFEGEMASMAKQIHDCGGLVYMDGANMNAIAGRVNLGALGVDCVHNNLHKTWSIPHGGGGPGDALVCVSEALVDYLPGPLVRRGPDGYWESFWPSKSIGPFHRHRGHVGHKIRAYTYLRALGTEGIPQMSAGAVLSARYLQGEISKFFPTLPTKASHVPRMHEFIITLEGQTL